jgi:hypothetical protein
MRDARINTIGEGANDVLKAFIAVVGCKGPGEYLKGIRDDVLGGRWSIRKLGAAFGAGAKMYLPWTVSTPDVPVRAGELKDLAARYGKLVREFGLALPHVFLKLKDEARFVQAQQIHERLADIAIDLYVSACVLARLDHLIGKAGSNGAVKADLYADVPAGKYFLTLAHRRIKDRLAGLEDHDDAECVAVADGVIGKF